MNIDGRRKVVEFIQKVHKRTPWSHFTVERTAGFTNIDKKVVETILCDLDQEGILRSFLMWHCERCDNDIKRVKWKHLCREEKQSCDLCDRSKYMVTVIRYEVIE